jgi:hypothetical protein
MAFELIDGAGEVAEAPSITKGRAFEAAIFLILIAPSMSCPYSALFYWCPTRAL